MWKHAAMVLLLLFSPVSARAESASDPVLEGLDRELERSKAGLVLPGHLRPYFIGLTVKEEDYVTLSGKMGALSSRDASRARHGRAEVRVGDYQRDSSEDDEADWVEEFEHVPGTMLPSEDDPQALAHGLWLLTDHAYKRALSSHLKIRGAAVFRAEERRRPSFSPAEPIAHLDPQTSLVFDEPRWRETVRSLGRLLRAELRLEDHVIHVDAARTTRWLATSEGTRLRTEKLTYALSVSAWCRAADGTLVSHSMELYAREESGFPGPEELLARAAVMAQQLVALADAPVLEPYTGPAIITSKAAGVFFHEVLGHRLEGHRQDRQDEGQTFADHLGKSVLPSFLSVYDDPTLTTLEGAFLNGAYAYDDEGIPSQRVQLVSQGVLRGFLMSRRPVEGFKASNGHGRAQGLETPVARMGTLIVESTQSVSEARLKALLLKELRKQGLATGVIVRELWGGVTNTSTYGYQAFKGEARLVYTVDARTGEETLVRGVDVVGTPLSSLGQILATGREYEVFNGYCGAESGMVPVSSVAPAVLLGTLELQRSTAQRARAPVLDAPHSPRRRSK